ncbi:C39 family peptidase [Alkalihalobacillus sp. AL-G]|uniref:C39 family peptidase n=1 Tax=Alkalihalobacillus sp. AL-G TaxID=2926399 RepID=UPI00272B0375|nr:C39 family peptidase [Alkalihalobacillus sp. AL-G]WLD93058.1 C39 family peptidase [Alkalihalobacillus sp. AL-G]
MKNWIRVSVIVSMIVLLFTPFNSALAHSITKIDETMYMSASIGNIRNGPGLDHDVILKYRRGTPFHVIGYTTNSNNEKWYQIKFKSGRLGWASSTILKANDGTTLDVPLISQQPQLARGCEVTSLAMMLQYAGIDVGKMTLAEEVKKDPTPYSVKNGHVHFGNPNTGFVGNMYTFSEEGYGVYHGPIAELAEHYLPNRVINFTGSSFETIFKYLDNGTPVWVINNTWFDHIPSEYWETWQTPTGPVKITMKEHSVLVTGYDEEYIYFNDPLSNVKNRKIPIEKFKRGWEQMGSQAITYKK